MYLIHVNEKHFRILHLKNDCPIPLTSVPWAPHCRDNARPENYRYIHMMIVYNELSRVTFNEIIGDDDVVIVETFDSENYVIDDKKVEDGVKIEVDSLGLDDCSIDHLDD